MGKILFSVFMFSAAAVFGQNLMNKMNEMQGIITAPAQMQQPITPPVLDQAVDPEKYVVGPGDYFSIVLGGQYNVEEHQLMVGPEGILFIPNIGQVRVAKLTLAQAREAISQPLRTKYISVNPNILLLQLRSFRVTVSGAVNKPGLVIVNALDRVSDAIGLSEGFVTEELMEPNPFPAGYQ